jgi:hypothetical protein
MLSGPLCCVCLFLSFSAANANAFLKANHKTYGDRISEADVQTSLLAEVEGGLGTSTGSKVDEFEVLLKPVFNALPKNEHGRLSHTTVRYALHRFFVHRHGWFIQGLDKAGQSWNEMNESSAGILTDQVPAYVQDLFEQRLAGKGLGLHELAVLAATVEHLVHSEALSKLGEAYTAHNKMPTSVLDLEDANDILETYMMMYILGEHVKGMSPKTVQTLKRKMPEIYLAWPQTRLFIRNVRTNVTDSADKLDFAMVARVAERVGEQFGKFQDKECHQLKSQLLQFEDRNSGRLRLADFYKPAYGGENDAWQFQESAAYLRQLGALDETDVDDQKVIIANYLGSQANCIGSSSFYSVCCMDECEGLLVHLENDIKAPEATPERIAALVRNLASASVSAPREISPKLHSRLQDIAAMHGGTVPLHGRLFMQWMHHAYPRECPYPHVAGTTAPQAAVGWMEASGDNAVASDDEMQAVIEKHQQRNTTLEYADDDAELVPWSHEEELLVVRPVQQAAPPTSSSSLRSMFLFALISSIAFGLVRNFKPATMMVDDAHQKFYV